MGLPQELITSLVGNQQERRTNVFVLRLDDACAEALASAP